MRTVLSDTELKPGLLRSPYDLTAAWLLLFLVPLASYLLLTGKSRMGVYAGIAAAGILLAAGLWIGLKKKNRFALAAALVFLAVGCTRTVWVRLGQTHTAQKLAQTDAAVHRFDAVVDRAEISSRYLFVRLTGAEGETFETPVLVYVPNTGGDFTSPGDKMSFTARFRLPEDANSEKNGESTFDRTAWLKSRGVYGELYDVTSAETVSSAEQTFHAKFCDTLFSGARKAWETQQNKAYYDDIAALAQGLLYGDKGDFSKIENQNFASSGLTHILCVSGLHFTLVIGGFGWFLKKLVRSRKAWLAAMFVLSGIYLYVCGFTPSAMRAAFMAFAVLFGLVRGGRRCTENLIFAAALICLFKPEAVFDIGFRLSVLSCEGILLGLPLCRILEARLKSHGILKFLMLAVLISFSAYGFTYFYCQKAFTSVGLGNIPASLIGVFPAQIFLGFAWAAVIVVPLFPMTAGFFGTVFARLTEFILETAAYFAAFPRIEAGILQEIPGAVLFFGLYFLAFLAVHDRIRGLKIWFLMSCAMLAAVTAGICCTFWR